MNRETTTIETGSHTCPWWLIFTFDNPLSRLIHDPEKILEPYVESGDTVLDVGCGMGFFSLGLAQLVGKDGKVIPADLQEQMLAGLKRRAERAGLFERIQLQQSTPDQIGVSEPVDFALAFWIVHEVGEPAAFLGQIHELLQPGGKFLIVEPRIHVSGKAFEKTMSLAKTAGFQEIDRPGVRASRAVLFRK
jgi:ubiquinone/menaquinone biosynthesis C-methylase UbiE